MTAIIYFSHSNTTAEAAKRIADLTGGKLLELKRVPDYPAGYQDCVDVADEERQSGHLPTISVPAIPNDGEPIYLGFPTWWHQPPVVIHALFKTDLLAGREVIPFTTSMSDPIDVSMPDLEEWATEAGAKLKPGIRVTANEEALRQFIETVKEEA